MIKWVFDWSCDIKIFAVIWGRTTCAKKHVHDCIKTKMYVEMSSFSKNTEFETCNWINSDEIH